MCSLDIFAVIIILLLVLIIMSKEQQVVKKEFLVRDYRPHAYLIYSSDPAKCSDCTDLADRFLLSVGRKDRYIAHMWNIEQPVAKASVDKFAKERKLSFRMMPTMIIERDGILDAYEGTEIIRLAIRDMV